MTASGPAVPVAESEGARSKSRWYVIPVVISNLIQLATLPLFLRFISRDEYGAWALCYAYGLFVSGVANFGMTISYERNFFEYRNSTQGSALLYSTVAFVAVNGLVAILATGLWRTRIAHVIIGREAHGSLLFWTATAVVVASIKTYFLIYLRNDGQASLYAWYTIDETLLGMVFSLILVVFLRSGASGLAWGPLAASTTVLALLAVRFARRLRPALNGSLVVENLKISAPLAPRLLLGVVATQFDKYVVGLLTTLGAVAVYAIGQKVANLVFTYMSALENVFLPEVYRRMFDLGDDASASVGRYLTPFAYFSAGIALLICLGSEEILAVLAPVSYASAQSIVNILAINYALMFFGKQPHLTYARKTWITSALTFVSIAMNATLTVLLVRWLGFVGAACGSLLAGLISTTLFVSIGQRYCRIDYEWRKLALIFGLLFAASLSMIGLRVANVPFEYRLSAKILWISSFVVTGILLRIITKDRFVRLLGYRFRGNS